MFKYLHFRKTNLTQQGVCDWKVFILFCTVFRIFRYICEQIFIFIF